MISIAPTKNGKAEKGEKTKKTTDHAIPGKEKAWDRRKENLPLKKENDESDRKTNRDAPKAEKQNRPQNDNKDKGKEKRKKDDVDKKSKR